MATRPSAAIARNQSTVIGPNSTPITEVPLRCNAKSAITTPTAIGTTYGLKAVVPTSSPSTADSTEIAGVSTASP